MSMDFNRAKLALALRTARTAIGYNQKKMASECNICTTSLARLEVMEAEISVPDLIKLITTFKGLGVSLDVFADGEINISINQTAISSFYDTMSDVTSKRSDKGTTRQHL